MDFLKKYIWVIVMVLLALSYFFVDWSKISIFNLFK